MKEKITSNKTKHIVAENKINDLTNKVTKISEKGYEFLLGRMYFIGNDSYKDFLVFAPMLSSLILDIVRFLCVKIHQYTSFNSTSMKLC